MNKTYIIVSAMVALVTCLGTSASADMYFEDMIDNWGLVGADAVLVTQSNPLEYQHDITDDGVPAEYEVTEAWLELDFTNDWTDEQGVEEVQVLWWTIEIPYDFTENATVYLQYDPVANSYAMVSNLGEVDNGQDVLAIDVDWLNDDGLLDVAVGVSNPLNTATLWLDHSKLYGTMRPVPVPGAVLLGMLGLSAAGIKLRRRA